MQQTAKQYILISGKPHKPVPIQNMTTYEKRCAKVGACESYNNCETLTDNRPN